MLSFAIRTPNDPQQLTWCNLHHLQLMLSFIGVKHPHIQEILDYINSSIGEQQQTFELDHFLHNLKTILNRFRYTNPLIDLEIAWYIVHRQQSVCILLGGTSGTGKSTLASLLAHRIGITTVLSTDHVRSLLRSFDPEHKSKVLWASSYHAGENLPDKKVIDGYKAQSQLMLDTLDKMLKGYIERKESLVIEGVGLSIDTMKYLAKNNPNCIPLVIYISNEHKHTERFAVRAKYMTVAPRTNKYIRYFDNIRLIQNHLCQQADEYYVPKIDNTNVDRSLAILHTVVVISRSVCVLCVNLNVLARMKRTNKNHTIDPVSDKFVTVFEEYTKVHLATWSSKQMLQRIRHDSTTRKSKPYFTESIYNWKEQLYSSNESNENNEANNNNDNINKRGPLSITKPGNVLLACQTRWKAAVKAWISKS